MRQREDGIEQVEAALSGISRTAPQPALQRDKTSAKAYDGRANILAVARLVGAATFSIS